MYNMLDYFFGPAILAAIGLIFMAVGAIPKIRSAGKNTSQDQVEEKPKNETAKFEPSLKGLIIWLEDVSITERMHRQLIFGGAVLLLFGGCWALALATKRPSVVIAESVGPTQTAVAQTQTAFLQSPTLSIASSIQSTYSPLPTLLGVSLVSAQYASGGWEPRSIDLSTSAKHGIFAYVGTSLRLSNLMVSVPLKLSGYRGKLQVYAGDKLIGESSTQDLIPDVTNFAEINPTGFQDPNEAQAWKTQAAWDTLYINLVITGNDKFSTEGYIASLRLNKEDTSWYLTPPYASISAVVYRVKNGPQKQLNLQAPQGACLDASPGDALSIDQIWYRTRSGDQSANMQAKVYFVNDQSGAHDDKVTLISPSVSFTPGADDLLKGKSLTWDKIPEDHMMIVLVRNDQAILDRIDCHSTTTPTGLDWGGNTNGLVRFGSILDLAEFDPGFRWEPGNSPSSGYAIERSILSLTTGPWTNQFGTESSAPIVAYPVKGNFETQVKLILHPTKGAYAGMGLRSSQDKTTWIRLSRTWDDTNNGMAFGMNKEGQHYGYDSVKYGNDIVYIKILRRAGMVTFLYSADGQSWTSISKQNFDLPDKVEIYFYILASEQTTAQFEDFRINPIQ